MMPQYCGHHELTVVLVTSLLVSCMVEAQFSASDFIINVDFVCPKEATGVTKVTVETDIPDTSPFAYCRDPFTYYYMEKDASENYKIDISFEGSDSDVCVFTKAQSAKIYTVEVYVPMAGGVFTSEDLPHLITCSYEDTGEKESDPTVFADSFKPVEESLHNMGSVGKSGVKLHMEDMLGRKVTDGVPLGSSIRLVAELTGDYANEVSFQAVSCKAVSKDKHYLVLVGGCGDGIVIVRNKGFVTKDKRVTSPFFRSFRIRGSNSLSFDCTFAICKTKCDGDSCSNAKNRKKREIRYVHVSADGSMQSLKASDYLITDDMGSTDTGSNDTNSTDTGGTNTTGISDSYLPHVIRRKKVDPVSINSVIHASPVDHEAPTGMADTSIHFPNVKPRPMEPQPTQLPQQSTPLKSDYVGIWLLLGISVGFSLLLSIIMVLITKRLLLLMQSMLAITTNKTDSNILVSTGEKML